MTTDPRIRQLKVTLILLLTMGLGLLFLLASTNPRFAVTIPLIAGHNLVNVFVVVLIAAPMNMALAYAMTEPLSTWALGVSAGDVDRLATRRLALASGALVAAHLGAVLPIAGAIAACQLGFLAWRQHHRAQRPWQLASLFTTLFAALHIVAFGWRTDWMV